MKKIIQWTLLLMLLMPMAGCQQEKNTYLGDLDISYTAWKEDKEIEDNVLGFYYGYSLTKYKNQYDAAFAEDSSQMIGFTIDTDINALQEQMCTIEGYQEQTWEYYFVDQAVQLYQEIEGLYIEAIQEGYTITNEDTQKAKEAYDIILAYCQTNDIKEEDYLHSTFGKQMDVDTLLAQYANIEMVQRYVSSLWVEPTPQEVEGYYEMYKDDIDMVTIRYFAFEKDNKEQAETFVKQATSEAMFKQLAITYSTEENKEYYRTEDITLREHLQKEDVPNYLQEAIFDTKNIGTTMLIEGISSYDVVQVVAREKPTYQQANVSVIYLDAREYDKDTVTEEKLQTSKTFAEEVLLSIEAEETMSLDVFHQYNKKYSDDKNNQGDYDDVSRSQTSKEVGMWLFDEARQVGDMTVLPGTYGYSILYFRGYGERQYYQKAKDIAKDQMYEEKIKEVKDNIVITIQKK